MVSLVEPGGADLLRDKCCVITGASRGIGRALANGLAGVGASVALLGRNSELLGEVARQIASKGSSAVSSYVVDVREPEEVQRTFHRILEDFGHVDLLVNNAGTTYVSPSEEPQIDRWKTVIDTNLTGAFLCAQAAGRTMLARGSGSMINIASLTSFVGQPNRAAYASSKAAIAELTRVLAVEWGPRGVRVNAVAPGYIETDLTRNLIDRGVIDRNKIERRTPLRRMGRPEDLIGPVVFLASDASAFVTGQVIVVDGGWLANGYIE